MSSEPPIILGSASPRRMEIVSYFQIPIEQIASDFDERRVPFRGDPREYVQSIAQGKGHALSLEYPDRWILTSDTTVYRDGRVYDKPSSLEEAHEMLQGLVGTWHEVFTAVCFQKGPVSTCEIASTRVKFRELNSDQIRRYVDHTQPLDKAGAYAVQGSGGLIVESIEGSFYNVMGLPLGALATVLQLAGIDLWQHLGENHVSK